MASTFMKTPKPAPGLAIPQGASAKVQIIDTTAQIQGPVHVFAYPEIYGHKFLRVPCLSFLVEQVSSGRKVLFDLGLRKDYKNSPPAVMGIINSPGWEIEIEKSPSEILQGNGVDVAGGAIEAIVWSHWHFDHTGDPSLFPHSTAVITGTGVKEALLPGYPTNPHSPIAESALQGREHREIDFDKTSNLKIGQFPAFDYFGDGSFYLLDAPGHAIGHMCGLARTKSTLEGDEEDTFIFMGGDTAHHGGEFRPSNYLPLPESIEPSPFVARYPSVCPGHIFESMHPVGSGARPFYNLHASVAHDLDQADQSCHAMQDFDAAENVFVVIAHDNTVLDKEVGLEWFPHGTLRNWKERDCARKVRWAFLKDFTDAVVEAEKRSSA